VFHKCKTFVQEADPWQWLAALEQIRALDAEIIVPHDVDPYPIGQRLFPRSDWVTEANIRNIYKRVVARQTATPDSAAAARH
jgi:hypothetical protein